MKYRTFVKLRAAVLILLVVLAVYGVFHRRGGQPPQVAVAPIAAPPAAAATAQPPADPALLTDAQREILHLQGQPLTNGAPAGNSRKWVVDEPGFHAEFRCDTGKGLKYWNRVKIDWNGNKRFDERWDFKPDGTVKRRIAPNDDENYTQERRLEGDRWAPQS